MGTLIDTTFDNLVGETCRVVLDKDGYTGTAYGRDSVRVTDWRIARGAKEALYSIVRQNTNASITVSVDSPALISELKGVYSANRTCTLTLKRGGTTRFKGYLQGNFVRAPKIEDEERSIELRATPEVQTPDQSDLTTLSGDWLDSNGDRFTGTQTFATAIADILGRTGFSFPIEAVIQWRPTSMGPGDDPLSAQCRTDAFYRTGSDGQLRAQSAGKVLESLCGILNAQVVLGSGVWRVVQPEAYADGSDVDVWEYDATGALKSGQPTTQSTTVDLTGETWESDRDDPSVRGISPVNDSRVVYEYGPEFDVSRLQGGFESMGETGDLWDYYDNNVETSLGNAPRITTQTDSTYIRSGSKALETEENQVAAGTDISNFPTAIEEDYAENRIAAVDSDITGMKLLLRAMPRIVDEDNDRSTQPDTARLYWGLRLSPARSNEDYFYSVNALDFDTGGAWVLESNLNTDEKYNLYQADDFLQPQNYTETTVAVSEVPERGALYIRLYHPVSRPTSGNDGSGYTVYANWDDIDFEAQTTDEPAFTARSTNESIESGQTVERTTRLGTGPFRDADGYVLDNSGDPVENWSVLGKSESLRLQRLAARRILRLRELPHEWWIPTFVNPSTEPEIGRGIEHDGTRYWPRLVQERQPGNVFELSLSGLALGTSSTDDSELDGRSTESTPSQRVIQYLTDLNDTQIGNLQDGRAVAWSADKGAFTLQANSTNYLSVDDFLSSGATKKSGTNAKELSNAINQASSQNRALYVPDKTYYIDSGFTFDKSIRMLGEGTFALPPGEDTFDQMVTVTADDVVMEGVTWDASEASSNFSSGRGETLRWIGDNAKVRNVTAVGLDGSGSNVTNCFVLYSKNGTFLNCTARKATFAGFRCVPGAGTLRLLGCESFDHATRGFMASARNFINDSPQLASNANSGDSSIDVENYVPNFGDIIGIRGSDADDLFYVAGVFDQGGGVFTVTLEDPNGSAASLSSGYSSGKDITYNEGGLIIEDAVVGEPSGNATSFSVPPSGLVLDSEPQVLKMLYVGAPRAKASGTSIKVGYAESAIVHGASGDVDPGGASTFGFSSENEWQTRRFLRNLHVSGCRLTGRAIFDAQERITVRDTRLENGPRYIDKGATDGDYEYNARVRTPGEAIFDNVSFFGATKEAIRLQGDSTGEKQKLRLKSPRFHQDAADAEPVQIVGGVKGNVEVNGSQTAGTSSVDIRTGNSSWVKLTEGEIITFASHSQEYEVQSSLRMPPGSTETVDIDPALQQDVSDGENVGGQGKMWPGRVRVSDPEFQGGTRRITNKFEFEDYVDHQMGREHVPFFHSGDLRTNATYYDSGGTQINHARLHWRTGSNATQTGASDAAFGTTSGRPHLELTGSDWLGRKLSTVDCRRFVLDAEMVEGEEVRPYIIAWDEGGNRITASGEVISLNDRSILAESGYGGHYRATGERDRPLYFEVSRDVAEVEVGVLNASGTSKFFSLSIHALQAARHVDSWAEGSMGDYPQAKEEPAQWGGHPGEGVWVLHESPTASDMVAWIAQPNSTVPIGDGTIDVEDSGTSVLTSAETLNFADSINATDQGGGEAKVDLPQPFVNIGETTLTEQDGESELRSMVTGADFGDEVVLQNGFEAILSGGALTIPEGVKIRGYDRRDSQNTPSIKKGADGPVLKYQDNVQIENLFIHGNKSSYTGSNLVPTGGNSREVYMHNVWSWYADEAALIFNETYLSTFINVSLANSTDGLRVVGSAHSPHVLMARCRMAGNGHAGIDIRHNLDKMTFLSCLIDKNTYGIDTVNSSNTQPIGRKTKFCDTIFQKNDGPGIACRRSSKESNVINLNVGTLITGNNVNPPSGLTAPVGEIHSETGGRIGGTINGGVGDIRRKNSDGLTTDLTINGSTGDLELPDTILTVANEREIGTVEAAQTNVRLDPTGGGKIVGLRNTASVDDMADLSEEKGPLINIGETTLTEQDGESELRSLVTGASFGDEIVLQNGFQATLSGGAITIPEGVKIRAHSRQQPNSPTIKKGADGPVLKYQDNVQIENLFIHGNKSSYTGSNLVPTGGSSHEVYMENVWSYYADEAALVWDETSRSTFINLTLLQSTDGLRVAGSGNSPHVLMQRCRMAYNDHAGIDIRHKLSQDTFSSCLIEQNTYGIDTIDSSVGRPISGSTGFSDTIITKNDGPGIALRGSTATSISLKINDGSSVANNNKNTPSSLTTPAGDLHSENGGRIDGVINGRVGDVRRKNSDGYYTDLTINGSAGDLEVPDTHLMVANERNIGTVESVRSLLKLDPTDGGKIKSAAKSVQVNDMADLSKEETFDKGIGIHGASPASQGSLTPKDGATVDGTYGTEEEGVIRNNRTRLAEIEDILVKFGLLS